MSARTAFITGCSSGFGLGLAQALHANGWDVTAAVRDALRPCPGLAGIRVIPLDLEDDTQIRAAVVGIDRLDCLINNAGYALTGPFLTYAPEQMQRQLKVNVLGPALVTQLLLPALKRARGRVINVSSIAGETGLPMNTLYCAAKHAIEGLSEALRHELAPHGVQVSLVEPGGFRTRFAENMEWGVQAVPAASTEARQLAGYRAMRERILARQGRDPALVVDEIVRLAGMKVMPLRTRIGAEAWLMRSIKRWLPERAALGILGAVFRRAMAGGKLR